MTTNFREKSAKLAYPLSFVTLTFQNELEYGNADARINSKDDPPTSSRN